jgi:hypothetical protein
MSELRVVITDYTFPHLAVEEVGFVLTIALMRLPITRLLMLLGVPTRSSANCNSWSLTKSAELWPANLRAVRCHFRDRSDFKNDEKII